MIKTISGKTYILISNYKKKSVAQKRTKDMRAFTGDSHRIIDISEEYGYTKKGKMWGVFVCTKAKSPQKYPKTKRHAYRERDSEKLKRGR